MTCEACPVSEAVPDDEPVLPDRAADDDDRGWGERPDDADDDERLTRERPPHW